MININHYIKQYGSLLISFLLFLSVLICLIITNSFGELWAGYWRFIIFELFCILIGMAAGACCNFFYARKFFFILTTTGIFSLILFLIVTLSFSGVRFGNNDMIVTCMQLFFLGGILFLVNFTDSIINDVYRVSILHSPYNLFFFFLLSFLPQFLGYKIASRRRKAALVKHAQENV